MPPSSSWDQRRELRLQTRRLLGDVANPGIHWERLQAALALAGNEPAQGALADIFFALDAAQGAFKKRALQASGGRLAAHVASSFEANAQRGPISRITPLATRWSVLARPCTDIATRARRCSPDTSRELARLVQPALAAGDTQSQQEFLHHCVTCHDKLAFMLARRELLRHVAVLPPPWESASEFLEQAREPV